MFNRSMSIGIVHSALSLLLILLGVWHALAGRAADLVEGRRRLRILYAVAVALYTMLIIASGLALAGGSSAAPLSLANAIGLVTLIFLFAVLGSPPAAMEQLSPPPSPPTHPLWRAPDRPNLSAMTQRQRRSRRGPMQRCSRRCAG